MAAMPSRSHSSLRRWIPCSAATVPGTSAGEPGAASLARRSSGAASARKKGVPGAVAALRGQTQAARSAADNRNSPVAACNRSSGTPPRYRMSSKDDRLIPMNIRKIWLLAPAARTEVSCIPVRRAAKSDLRVTPLSSLGPPAAPLR